MMQFEENMDGKWLTIILVPDFIEAHSGRQFGEPTMKQTRVTTRAGANAYDCEEWEDYKLTKEQALVAYAFEAGREYQHNRKLRKRIDDACHNGWEESRKQREQQEIDNVRGEGI